MLIQLLGDLRFVIGLFFSIISTILIIAGVLGPAGIVAEININLFAGSMMGLFSILMISLSLWAHSFSGIQNSNQKKVNTRI